MPWFDFKLPWSDTIKKKVCRYLLQRYLGQFLEEKLKLEQLNVDFTNGKGNVENVTLSSEALNEICESQGWDVEVTGGRIGSVTVNVPWKAPMAEDSYIEIGNLFISLRPMARQKDDDTGMLESMWSSMSSSMQLAQECLEREGDVPLVPSNTIDGLERFAQLIDNVLNRIKAKFVDTTLRLEYLCPENDYGVAIIIKIDNVEYENEAGGDPPDKDQNPNNDDEDYGEREHESHGKSGKSFLLSTYSSHHLKMDGITFYTEEFRIYNPRKHTIPKSDTLLNTSELSPDQFLSAISEIPGATSYLSSDQSHYEDADDDRGEQTESGDSAKPEIEILSTEPLLLGKLTSTQEIRIKMKQVENLPGPKVELEMTLGALTMLMSPRQLQLVNYMIEVLLYLTPIPKAAEPTVIPDRESTRERSRDSDIDFYNQKFSAMSGVIGVTQQGWSSTANDLDDQLYRSTETNTSHIYAGISESVMSSNSSMTSSISSSATSGGSKSRKRGIEADPNADISHFKLRVACVVLVLLHDDILVEADSMSHEAPLTEQSVKKLKSKAETFFEALEPVTGNVRIGANDITKIAKTIENALEYHNLRLILTPIIVEGEEQRNTSGTMLKCNISIARADFSEHLNDITIPLLKFIREGNSPALPSRPEIMVNYKQTRAIQRTTSGKRLAPPKTEFNVSLARAEMELDISIMDRISAVLYKEPFSISHIKVNAMNENDSGKSGNKSSGGDAKTELKVDCSQFDFKLRFPIADLRPIHDPQRVPWWSRNVRQDFLRMHLQQLNFTYNIPAWFGFQANQIDIFYHEHENAQPVELARTVMREVPSTRYSAASVEYPKIGITIPSEKSLQDLQERMCVASGEETDSDPTSGDSIKFAKPNKCDPTPFSSKRVLRESETRHSKDESGTGTSSNTQSDPESFIIPGDNAEMNDFCDKTMKLSKVQIEIDLPIVSLQLKSKQFYEVLYNRFNSDLLMWVPGAPHATNIPNTASTSTLTATIDHVKAMAESTLMNVGMMDSIYAPFAMCKSKINLESSTSASNSESETDSDNVFYSTYGRNRPTRKAMAQVKRPFVDLSSTSSFKMNIHKGIVTVYAPVRDSQNHVIPGQLGEFVIKVNSCYFFSVNGYRSNPNLAYLCFNGKSAEVYHCGLTPSPSLNPPLRLIGSMLPTHMKSTLYPTPKDLTQQQNKGSPNREMISLAIQIKKIPEQNIKRIRVSAGIQLTTLRHHSARPQHIWLTQLMDMFDVTDYPIQGYKSTSAITELHLHLWDCAIDYRPLCLPYRAVVTLGTFMISSNIASQNTGCTFRFIAEDCTLSLAPQIPPEVSQEAKDKEKYQPMENKVTVLPSSELVCVLELGLFEISLRLSEKVTASFPKFDLRAAINDVHIRTCSDSAAALARLIAYLAAEGDLENRLDDEHEDDTRMSTTSLNVTDKEDDLVSVKTQQQVVTVPEEQQKFVNTLLTDAMEDCSQATPESQLNDESASGVELFFFPDEAKQPAAKNRHTSISSEGTVPCLRSDSIKRRFASDDSISIDDALSLQGNSYKDEHHPPTCSRSYDTESVNTELGELLDFERSVMGSLKPGIEAEEMSEALPQVRSDLGDTVKIGVEAGGTGASGSGKGKETQPQRKISSDTDEDFCFISEEERPYFYDQDITSDNDPIRIVDNHFYLPSGKPDLLKAPAEFPMAVMRYTLCEMSLIWHIYGGNDFPDPEIEKELQKEKKRGVATSPTVTFSNKNMSDAYRMGVSYSKGSPSMQLGPSPWSKLTWRTRGGPGRKHDILMEAIINKVRFSHEQYPNNVEQASRQVLLITELEIRDRLAASNINKFLYHPSVGPKSKGTPHMIVIKALHLRPNPQLPAQECCLRISMLPLRLNIDQDSLLFLVKFFNEMAGGDDPTNVTDTKQQQQQSQQSQTAVAPYHPPIMMVELPDAAQELQARKMVNENLMLLLDKDQESPEIDVDVGGVETSSECEDNAPIYFRSIIFGPDVPIRLDYQGKRVEMSHGPIAGLLMGLGQLQCSEIILKRITYRRGILGIDKLIRFLIQEWLHDIKKRQLPKILGGVGPMYSVVQLFQGIFDLFWLPIEQYQKDGRIVRGLQRGAQSFTARTALAALEITTRLIHLLQITAETAYDMLSPGPSVRHRGRRDRKGKRKRLHPPPQDIREGVARAFEVVKEGIGDTAIQICEMAALEHDQKGAVGAVGAVLRQIPPTAVRPIVLATQATSNVLSGVKNQLVPDARMEARQKWKDEEE